MWRFMHVCECWSQAETQVLHVEEQVVGKSCFIKKPVVFTVSARRKPFLSYNLETPLLLHLKGSQHDDIYIYSRWGRLCVWPTCKHGFTLIMQMKGNSSCRSDLRISETEPEKEPCQLCWLSMNGRWAEVMLGLYWHRQCLPCVKSEAITHCAEAWERSH